VLPPDQALQAQQRKAGVRQVRSAQGRDGETRGQRKEEMKREGQGGQPREGKKKARQCDGLKSIQLVAGVGFEPTTFGL